MINLLDKETIDKIAAGEVADRPVSVIKELVENALDAGAANISIEIRDGGKKLMRVTDDGCGIPVGELRTAFMRHATSKLSKASDLQSVTTMGFRGEALASIAAVSRTELITKTADELNGTLIAYDAGQEKSFREVGAPLGTTVTVRDFLYNLPVRLNFLKSDGIEGSAVTAFIESEALAHPDISFSLAVDGRAALFTPGTGSMKDVIYIIFGKETVRELVDISIERTGMALSGFIAKPALTRSRRDREYFFVNGRVVSSDIIQKAAEDAFAPYLMQHRFPVVFLDLRLDPLLIDVNIHPRKTEIRFADPKAVYDLAFEAFSNALSVRELIPDAIISQGVQEAVSPYRVEPFEKERLTALKEEIVSSFDAAEELTPGTPARSSKISFFHPSNRSLIRIVGSVFDTYWIIEHEGAMYMVDQHAAHEKVNYERFTREISEQKVSSQLIFPPMLLSLHPYEAEMLSASLNIFNEAGYEIEELGGREFVVRAVPAFLPVSDDKRLLEDLIAHIFEERKALKSDILKDRIASMSCKAAIKGGHSYSFEEISALMDELFSLDEPYNCPHGRPTMIKWSKAEVDKLFKRIV